MEIKFNKALHFDNFAEYLSGIRCFHHSEACSEHVLCFGVAEKSKDWFLFLFVNSSRHEQMNGNKI